MIGVSVKGDFSRLEKSLMALAGPRAVKIAASTALTRTAVAARQEVMRELPSIFDRPTPFTVNSVRYEASSKETLSARVYISDDAAKGLSPRKYLGPEMFGGARSQKRSERQLTAAGIMAPGQQVMPGSGMSLDQFGNVSGSTMVRILSRVAAFGQQGYRANVSAAMKRRLAKRKLAHRRTGTDFFVAQSKTLGGPLGIYQIVASHVVKPVLIFANKRANYRPRFGFAEMVAKSARARFPGEMMKALHEEIARPGK